MIIGQKNDVTFKVNVMGTSAEAKVRLMLGTSPELSFPATKVGDDWKASILVPEGVKPGKYDMKVEVIVGNRHFQPLTKKVEITAPEVKKIEAKPAEEPMEPSQVAAVAADVPVMAQPDEISIEKPAAEPEKQAKSKDMDLVFGKKFFSIEDISDTTEAPVLVEEAAPAAEPVVEAPAPKMLSAEDQKAILEAMKKLTAPKTAPVKVKSEPLLKKTPVKAVEIKEEPKKVMKPAAKKPVKVVEIKHELPVKLTKGKIVYE